MLVYIHTVRGQNGKPLTSTRLSTKHLIVGYLFFLHRPNFFSVSQFNYYVNSITGVEAQSREMGRYVLNPSHLQPFLSQYQPPLSHYTPYARVISRFENRLSA